MSILYFGACSRSALGFDHCTSPRSCPHQRTFEQAIDIQNFFGSGTLQDWRPKGGRWTWQKRGMPCNALQSPRRMPRCVNSEDNMNSAPLKFNPKCYLGFFETSILPPFSHMFSIHRVATAPTRLCPPVISWFINPINYRYIYHKP